MVFETETEHPSVGSHDCSQVGATEAHFIPRATSNEAVLSVAQSSSITSHFSDDPCLVITLIFQLTRFQAIEKH